MAIRRKFPAKERKGRRRFSKSGPSLQPAPSRFTGKPNRFSGRKPFSRTIEEPQRRPALREQRPPCPHFPACYSCPFVQFPYLQQLEKKQARVKAAFANYPCLTALEIPPLIPSPRQFGYRTRVKLAVRKVSGKPVIGLYIPETHRIADASACPVHPQPVNEVIQFIKEAIERLDIAPYDEERDTGLLRYLDIRYSLWSHQVLLTLVTRNMHFPQVRDLIRELERRFPFVSGVVQNIHDKPGNVIWGDRFHPLRGRDSLIEKFGPLRLAVPVSAFAQANPPVALKLYQLVVRWAALTGDEIALDLYCGIGPIALHLAGGAKLVIGIDENLSAINAAKENARRNGYHNTRFFAGDSAVKLKETAANLARIDVMVVNPPRKGLSPETFAAVLTAQAPRLIYVSCDPDTLARDLDRFSQHGYAVQRVQSFDMFPQTEQVETAALLTAVRKEEETTPPSK
ncbi:MAG TPA: 23S rRNA (uracil(1939)-C(5))-methyltransferase RlmD [Methylomirabilota bacterium]|nr:23S rRNA (uracil(1939)-C(5))-methyltransferase RlmD [Methylomirabilota bacterium]